MSKTADHDQQYFYFPPPWPPPQQFANEEISLFEVWDALFARRWLIIVVTMLVLAAAVAYGYFTPVSYSYRTVIDVGSYGSSEADNGRQYLVQPETVRRKLEQAYIPAARKAFVKPGVLVPKVDVLSGSQSGEGLLVLRTITHPEQVELVKRLHERVTEHVLNQHQSLLRPRESRLHSQLESVRAQLAYLQHEAIERAQTEPYEQAVNDNRRQLEALQTAYRTDRRELENRLSGKKRNLAQLEQNHDRLQAQLDRLDERRALAMQQLTSTQELLDTLEKAQAEATRQISGGGEAMSLLAVGSQIGIARKRADDLEERLRVGLPSHRDELLGNLADNERSQQQAKDQIESHEHQLVTRKENYERNRADVQDKLDAARTTLAQKRVDYARALEKQKYKIDNAEAGVEELIPTRVLFTADRSLDPVGVGIKMLVMLGGALGLMLGIISASVAHFAQAARHRRERMAGVETALSYRQDG